MNVTRRVNLLLVATGGACLLFVAAPASAFDHFADADNVPAT